MDAQAILWFNLILVLKSDGLLLFSLNEKSRQKNQAIRKL